MLIRNLLKNPVCCLGFAYLMIFNAVAENAAVQTTKESSREEELAVVKDTQNVSSIQRCEVDTDSSEKICKEIYTYPSIICLTIDECEELVEKQISELNEIHTYLQKCEADEGCKETCREIYNNSGRSAIETCIGLSS